MGIRRSLRILNLALIQLTFMLGVVAPFGGTLHAKKPSTVKVKIESTPPNANIYVDGKEGGIIGQTGPDEIKLPKGSHKLILELDGFVPFEQTVNLDSGSRYSFKLQALPAKLEIKPLGTNQNSVGGEIFVDGTLAGTVPAKVDVPAGKHTIEVRRPGFIVYTDSVEVKTGETRQLLVALMAEQKGTPTTGALRITAPVAAEVTIDGQARGPSPVLVDNLSPGDHLVEVAPTDSKLAPWRRNVRVTVGQQGLVETQFTATPVAQAPPEPEKGSPVSIIARNSDNVYVVTLGNAQSCQTPCNLKVPDGRQVITVAGPGSKLFKSEITIPNSPAQVTVQHLTLGKAIGGATLIISGVPGLVTGAIKLADELSIPEPNKAIAVGWGSMLVSGSSLLLGAIGAFATIKLNRATVVKMGTVTASAPRLRLLSAGIAQTPDRTGAVSTLRFSF